MFALPFLQGVFNGVVGAASFTVEQIRIANEASFDRLSDDEEDDDEAEASNEKLDIRNVTSKSHAEEVQEAVLELKADAAQAEDVSDGEKNGRGTRIRWSRNITTQQGSRNSKTNLAEREEEENTNRTSFLGMFLEAVSNSSDCNSSHSDESRSSESTSSTFAVPSPVSSSSDISKRSFRSTQVSPGRQKLCETVRRSARSKQNRTTTLLEPSSKEEISTIPTAPKKVSARAERLKQNIAQGKAHQQKFLQHLLGSSRKRMQVFEEVTLEPITSKNVGAGYRLRLDFLTIDSDGVIRGFEVKSSKRATLTPNQESGFPLVEKYGAIVRTPMLERVDYYRGSVLSPFPIVLVRQGDRALAQYKNRLQADVN